MSDVITVTMLDVLRPDLEQWLHTRGLGLQHMGEDDADVDVYVVVIPKGSPLEAHLRDSRADGPH